MGSSTASHQEGGRRDEDSACFKLRENITIVVLGGLKKAYQVGD